METNFNLEKSAKEIEKIKFEEKRKRGLRKCPGHLLFYLRNSRVKKQYKREDILIKDCYNENGKCEICGGYKMRILG